jgi:hypothetical protein
MDIDRMARRMSGATTRRSAIATLATAIGLASTGQAAARRRRPGNGLVDFDECVGRLEDDICRGVAVYDRRMCKRAVGRCCKARQMTLQNATRCVERSLPRRPR